MEKIKVFISGGCEYSLVKEDYHKDNTLAEPHQEADYSIYRLIPDEVHAENWESYTLKSNSNLRIVQQLFKRVEDIKEYEQYINTVWEIVHVFFESDDQVIAEIQEVLNKYRPKNHGRR